jgi:large subunit ribosomal protein L29
MKADEVRNLDENELKAKVHEIQEQMFRLRFQMSMGQADGLKKVRNMKKDLARAYTELRARELAAAARDIQSRDGNGAVSKG